MGNSTVPLQGDLLLLNQLELVSPTTVAGTFYGIAFTIYCLYVHAMLPRLQEEDRKRQAKFMLAYSAVIMLCGLYILVADAWVTQDGYIKHSNYRGGPISYIVTTFHSPVTIVVFVCQKLIDILTSAIQIWRVWVIWSASRYAKMAIVLPSLCFLAFTALYLRTIIISATVLFEELVKLDYQTDIAEIAIQATNTILCTTLISVFLIVEQWRQRNLIGKAQGSTGYMKIIAILIESYALESIWLLIVAMPISAGSFFAETQAFIEIIAYLLVQYRVASGNVYESQRVQRQMSSLHWNHSNHSRIQFEPGRSEAGCDVHVSVKPEMSDV